MAGLQNHTINDTIIQEGEIMNNRIPLMPVLALCCFFVLGCTVNTLVADALTGEGGSDVFTGDSDPELVGGAIPFAIKMYESLLASTPNHQGLILTTGSLFVMYANAFVQGPAEMLPASGYAERQAAAERAKKLYLRGLAILYRGLELKYRGFDGAYQNGTLPKILAKTKKKDVANLYWAAAAGLSAYSLNPFDMELGVRIPEFFALVSRAYELDPDFNNGALDDFLVLYYASVPEAMGGDKARAGEHYRLALEKSDGRVAGPYVSYAQAISIPAQDYAAFKTCIDAALAIDPDADPSNRLVNIISQRKARYLMDNASRFFVALDNDSWD
jgi:predicted anti-sigma-YlaC factor YlaD